jgi:uncharacterized protein YjbI with pentapeptide repeats
LSDVNITDTSPTSGTTATGLSFRGANMNGFLAEDVTFGSANFLPFDPGGTNPKTIKIWGINAPPFNLVNDIVITNLSGANLTDTNLDGAKFNGTNLSNLLAEDMNFNNADFSAYKTSDSQFILTNLSGAVLADNPSNSDVAVVTNAKLNSAIMNGFRAEDVDFNGSDFSPFVNPTTNQYITSAVDSATGNLITDPVAIRTQLNNANLSDAELRTANLTLVKAEDLFAEGAKLNNAIAIGADLSRAYLGLATLDGANFSGGVELDFAFLEGASLVNTNLNGANLSNGKLKLANLTDATLIGANLASADLTNTNFTGANLNNAQLDNNVQASMADFINATLTNANLSGAFLEKTNFAGANLTGANLIGTNFKDATVEPPVGVTAGPALFVGAQFYDAATNTTSILEKAVFTGANFSNANLQGVNFVDGSAVGANFSNANLSNADFSNVDLTNADFTGATATGAIALYVGTSGANNLTGSGSNDNLFGNEGADTLIGEAGNDYLDGGAGNDSLLGGEGEDRLVGQAGNDILDGGAGDDSLIFSSGFGADIVNNFRDGADKIDLTSFGITFSNLNPITVSGGNSTITATAFGSASITVVGVTDLTANDFEFI